MVNFEDIVPGTAGELPEDPTPEAPVPTEPAEETVAPAVTEELPPEEPAKVEIPVEETPEILAEEAAETRPERPHIHFEVYSEDAAPHPAPAKPKKAKKPVGLWILVTVLILTVIAQMIGMACITADTVSVTGTTINASGELIVLYSDGSQENLGRVVGRDGMDGEDGTGGEGGGNTSVLVSDVSKAVTKGLRSSVSVFCTFKDDRNKEYSSAGSGVIYKLEKETGSAFIITNHHVVYDADSRTKDGISDQILVYLFGSEFAEMEMTATYVGGSMYYDIAILRIENSELLKKVDVAAITAADSDNLQAGSTAIAIGNAEASGISASYGVVSVPSEYITMTAVDGATSVDYRVIRVDAAVNHGNSGGGLFDDAGRLIGIVNAKTIDDGVENIGYALPSNVVVAVADNIIDYCYGTDCRSVMRPMMGVSVIANDSYAVYDDATGTVSIEQTITVMEVSPTQIGKVFQTDDVLISATLGNVTKQITRQHHIIDLMINARVGDTVYFRVLRDGKVTSVAVTITKDCLTEY